MVRRRPRTWLRPWLRAWPAAFCAAVLVQLVVLYAPLSGGPPPLAGLDKVVHAGVFAAVALTGLGTGFAVRPLTVVLVVHAGLSELVQAALLPVRSGDPADVVADVAGVLLGVLVGRWLGLTPGARRPSRRVGRAAAAPGLAPGPEREIMES